MLIDTPLIDIFHGSDFKAKLYLDAHKAALNSIRRTE